MEGYVRQNGRPGIRNTVQVIFMVECASRKRKLTAVCSHQTRIGNLDAHLI